MIHHNVLNSLIRVSGWLFVVAALWQLSTPRAHAEDFRDKLSWGPNRVGFRSQIVLDYSRQYETHFDQGATYGGDGKHPRPILVNLWYPADPGALADEAQQMPYRRYLELHSERPDVQRWAHALSEFAADVISEQFFRLSVAELDERQQQLWNRFLDSPTRCFINAQPLTGPFPVVIYHSGAGSSYEDNSVCFEYLASCGYVVVGSSYSQADGTGFAIDARDGSVKDMEFLVGFVAELPFADWKHIAYAGHSAGAQACLRAKTRPDCTADALVLLDTTVDYYALSIPTFDYVTHLALENVPLFNRPMLVVAGPEATFQMCDRLVNSQRTYLTVPELGHDEFISQGLQRLQVLAWQAEEQPSEETKQELQRSPTVEGNYVQLCQSVRAYLDAELLGKQAGFAKLSKEYAKTVLGEDRLALTTVQIGESGPSSYSVESEAAPTPRQLCVLINEVDVERFCEVLERHRLQDPKSPIYESNMLMGSLLYDLLEQERLQDARRLNTYAQGIEVDGLSTLRFLAFMSQLVSKPERARRYLEAALQIDPNDEESQRKLDELSAATNEQLPRN